MRFRSRLFALATVPLLGGGVWAQSPQTPLALSKECQAPSMTTVAEGRLQNVVAAFQKRKKIRVLAIGASSSAGLGGVRGGHQALIEQILEKTIVGLDVEIINRGVSGELAEDAAERLKNEVALTKPDLVIWQVGTSDALAQVPVDSFETSVTETVRWLKNHNVDLVLVGLHYARQMAGDPLYQAIRASVRRIATNENILRIGRYEAMEVISRAQGDGGAARRDEFELTENGYTCLAQYVARAIAAGLLAKAPTITPAKP